MSKPRPPKFNRRALPGGDDFEALNSRFRQFIDDFNEGTRSETFIALEGLSSIAGAKEGDVDLVKLRRAWPVRHWREQTVEVPLAFLNAVARAWNEYRNAPQGVTMGQSCGVEGGSRHMRTSQAKDDKDRRLSRLALQEYVKRG